MSFHLVQNEKSRQERQTFSNTKNVNLVCLFSDGLEFSSIIDLQGPSVRFFTKNVTLHGRSQIQLDD